MGLKKIIIKKNLFVFWARSNTNLTTKINYQFLSWYLNFCHLFIVSMILLVFLFLVISSWSTGYRCPITQGYRKAIFSYFGSRQSVNTTCVVFLLFVFVFLRAHTLQVELHFKWSPEKLSVSLLTFSCQWALVCDGVWAYSSKIQMC